MMVLTIKKFRLIQENREYGEIGVLWGRGSFELDDWNAAYFSATVYEPHRLPA
jgi:hypothetical protein